MFTKNFLGAGTALSTGERVMNKTGKAPPLRGVTFSWGRADRKQDI